MYDLGVDVFELALGKARYKIGCSDMEDGWVFGVIVSRDGLVVFEEHGSDGTCRCRICGANPVAAL